jgi:hypothetical protein
VMKKDLATTWLGEGAIKKVSPTTWLTKERKVSYVSCELYTAAFWLYCRRKPRRNMSSRQFTSRNACSCLQWTEH